jgi:predicted nucleic-acid-binding protein
MEKCAWVSILALAEATWVLPAVYERRATKIASAVEMLLNHKDLELQDPDVVTPEIYPLPPTGFGAFPLYCLMASIYLRSV